jgi:hypothetical protein
MDWSIDSPVTATQKKTATSTAKNSEEFVSFND